jgi:hypothetical protein
MPVLPARLKPAIIAGRVAAGRHSRTRLRLGCGALVMMRWSRLRACNTAPLPRDLDALDRRQRIAANYAGFSFSLMRWPSSKTSVF